MNLNNAVSFDVVRKHVAEQYALQNEDVVLDLRELRVTEKFDIEVPKLGVYRMTNWAKTQLGALLGIKWDIWFDPGRVTHQQAQEELDRRLQSRDLVRKIRSSRNPTVNDCDGELRAFVGPDYMPIEDEYVFDALEKRCGGLVGSLRFLPINRRWGDDRSTHYTLLADPVDTGPIDIQNADERTRNVYEIAARDGMLPSGDIVHPGLRIKNSSVGFCAFSIVEFTYRLVCLNGCILSIGDSILMRKRHSGKATEQLPDQLERVLASLPDRMQLLGNRLRLLKGASIENPLEFLEQELYKANVTKAFVESAKKAYELEPMPTAFGVVQAITRAATQEENINKRYEYEAIAGKLVRRFSA